MKKIRVIRRLILFVIKYFVTIIATAEATVYLSFSILSLYKLVVLVVIYLIKNEWHYAFGPLMIV